MNVSFTRDIRGVRLTTINGKRVNPVLIYRSNNPVKEQAVLDALNSDLLGRITQAILKAAI